MIEILTRKPDYLARLHFQNGLTKNQNRLPQIMVKTKHKLSIDLLLIFDYIKKEFHFFATCEYCEERSFETFMGQ